MDTGDDDSDPKLRLDFLYSSISDIQGTIRSIDTKISVLFVLLGLPIALLDKIYAYLVHIQGLVEPVVWIPVTTLLGLSWATGLVFSLATLLGHRTSHEHVSGSHPSGTFYSGDLFRHDKGFPCLTKQTLSVRTIKEQLSLIPNSISEIERELVFEQMKLVYIRDIKSSRQTASFAFAAIWIVFGIMVVFLDILNRTVFS